MVFDTVSTLQVFREVLNIFFDVFVRCLLVCYFYKDFSIQCCSRIC